MILKLTSLATRIRQIILATPEHKRPTRLIDFPAGACGDTSLLIGSYLIDLGYSNIEYVVGLNGEQSHAWLECGDIIIDITADQFGSHINPIIVTRDRTWHNLFKDQKREPGDFREYQDPTIYELYDFSEILVQAMEGEDSKLLFNTI